MDNISKHYTTIPYTVYISIEIKSKEMTDCECDRLHYLK